MSSNLFGARIRAVRTQRDLTQDELARRLGFNDRQTLSAIENGDRRVSAEELLNAAQALNEPLETFTDPFLLIGEGRFSWRQTSVQPALLTEYEGHAGRWVATYRTLAAQQGHQTPPDRRALRLATTSSFEDAMSAGERFAATYDLGDVPALRLPAVMQEVFGILVLMVDAIPGVSGAACRLPELDIVLINRHEIAGRRNYDLAHELFHILTWDSMPPAHVETAAESGGNRVEQLANKFASALLMPARVIASFGGWSELSGDALVRKLNQTADALAVTASALRWRLVALNQLSAAAAKAIDDGLLCNNGRKLLSADKRSAGSVPPLFSKPFLEVIARALHEGQLSVRRTATLLGVAIDDLPEMFAAFRIEAEVEV